MNPKDDTGFLQNLEAFNTQVRRSYDAIQTAGDKEALRGVLEEFVGSQLLDLLTSVADVARFGNSENARIQAARFLTDFYFDKQSHDDAFDRLLKQLTEPVTEDKVESSI